MVTVISLIFNENTRASLEGSIENIQLTIENLRETTSTIDTLVTSERTRMASIISNVESITHNISSNNEVIASMLRNLSALSDTLASANIGTTIAEAQQALHDFQSISRKINEGDGSISLLLNDESLYRRLDRSAADLDLLLQDVRLNPHRYLHFSILGKSARKNLYTPPDTSIQAP